MFKFKVLLIFAVVVMIPEGIGAAEFHRARFNSNRKDYLQMESVEEQLDPEIKSKANSLVKGPSNSNAFSRVPAPAPTISIKRIPSGS
jgi:hypothetical protein